MLWRTSFAVLLAAFLAIGVSRSADAVIMQSLTGTPSCDGAGTCNLAVSGMGSISLGSETTAVLDIAIPFPNHIELLDVAEPFSEDYTISGPGNFQLTGLLRVTFAWLDMNGAVLPGGLSFTIERDGGVFGEITRSTDVGFDSVIFHGLRITYELINPQFGQGFMQTGADFNVTFGDFDDGSNVGVWELPEPATIALFGLGLAGLGVAMWRRRAV